MTEMADLKKLVELRALRERRAEIAAARANARLDAAEAAVRQNFDALLRHDLTEKLRDAEFHQTMTARRFGHGDLAQAQDLVLQSELNRSVLTEAGDAARKAVEDSRAEAEARRRDWQRAIHNQEKLRGVADDMTRAAAIRSEMLAETEQDDTARGSR